MISDGQTLTDIIPRESCAVAPLNDRSTLHDDETVRQLARKVKILLYEDDGHILAASQIRNRSSDILDDRRLDALGRLIQQKQPWSHDQRATDGELLLLTAGQIASPTPQHGLEDGEQLENFIRDGSCSAFERREGRLQVFLHREEGENLAPLRYVGNAERRTLEGFEFV